MRILVFSDSHGKYKPMRDAMEANPFAAAVLFLGDGIKEFELLKTEFPGRIYDAVRGNCDIFSASCYQCEKIVTFGNKMILMMHGHTRNVKSTLEEAIAASLAREADILLYGHTHCPRDEYILGKAGEKPLRVFNPGSIGGRGEWGKTYGILDIGKDKAIFTVGKIRV